MSRCFRDIFQQKRSSTRSISQPQLKPGCRLKSGKYQFTIGQLYETAIAGECADFTGDTITVGEQQAIMDHVCRPAPLYICDDKQHLFTQ
ncbi:MAG: hypothetical protein ABIO46_08880 [Chitinophagales bacterium]